MTEFDIIRRYFTRAASDVDVVLGIGDDAAVLKARGVIVVAVDTLVAGVHFPPDTLAADIAHRALAVNLSDLAAMGARPRWFTLALTLPAADPAWLEGFASGLFRLADRYGISLVGGDTTRGPLTVTVQLIGSVEPGEALTRGGGHEGDAVYVTGSLGDGAAGLALLQRERQSRTGTAEAALVERFLRPAPRVEAGLALRGLASAAIDISDGLVADLGHLCAASGCGAVIDVERVPLSAELTALFPRVTAETYALSGGDDYELCFTAPQANAPRAEAAMRACGLRVTRIGRLTAGVAEVVWRRGGEAFLPTDRGYAHF